MVLPQRKPDEIRQTPPTPQTKVYPTRMLTDKNSPHTYTSWDKTDIRKTFKRAK